MAACVARQRKRDNPELEPMPIEACMAVAPRDDLECSLEYGHVGKHSWQRQKEQDDESAVR